MVIQGKAKWAKITGAPGWGYKKQYKEWSFDLGIDDATKNRLLEAGMHKQYIKNKDDDRGDFITFKRRELKKDGTPGKPIEVVDRYGKEWDPKKLIGNGSILNVKIALNEIPDQKGTKPGCIKVQVWDLVEYEGGDGDSEDFPVADGSEEPWA